MKVRRVTFAFVSAAYLAAFATTCGAALASSDSPSTQLARAGFTALQEGRADQAIAHFTAAIESRELTPEMLANALLNRALAYQHQKNDALAIGDYTAALQLDVMSSELRATALYNRGLSHQKIGGLSVAIQDFTSALLLNPEFSQAFFSRGNALRDSGQLLFALSDYDRALRYKHPDTARVHYGAALTYIALRRPHDARKALGKALDYNPGFALAREQLAKLGNTATNTVAESETDPIMTGSVAVLSNTVAKKPELPKAIDLPAELDSTKTYTLSGSGQTIKKRYPDRLPGVELAAADPATEAVAPVKKLVAPQPEPQDEQEVVIDVDQVPAIPEPEGKSDAANSEPVTSEPESTEVAEAAQPAEEQIESKSADTLATKPIGWMVQIASAPSEEDAWSAWKKLQSRYGELKDQKAVVIRADLGTKGVFYRLRLHGFDDKSGARDICSSLKQNGLDCFVSKPQG